MLLLIDIGNTNISIGVSNDSDDIIASFRLTTNTRRTEDEFSLDIASVLHLKKIKLDDINDVVISSVVPKLDISIKEAIRKTLNIEPLFVSPNMNSGMKIKIDEPNSLGADRLVDAVAAYEKYHSSVLVIDFGTASTFDLVNDDGEFVVGITAPGLDATARSLWEKTAKLPEVELIKPKSILTKNTIDSMQAGIMYGYIGLTKSIIEQVKREVNKPFKVLATGGLGKTIFDEVELIDDYDPDLAFKGMLLLYKRSKH